MSTTWPQLKHESFDSEQVLQKLCPQGIINIGQCSGAICNQMKHFHSSTFISAYQRKDISFGNKDGIFIPNTNLQLFR